MELSFANKDLRDICEDENIAKDRLGISIAKALQARFADMIAAKNVQEILAGQPGPLGSGINANYKVDLSDGRRLVFSANHTRQSHIENGAVNWSKVTRIKLLQIENTNG